jgi:CRP-like cAMP-binding protein
LETGDFDVVKGQPLFSGLSDDTLQRLVENSQPRIYPKGRMIFQRGDQAGFFYVILEGWVKIFRQTPDGDEALLCLFSRGDMFAEAAAFMGTGYPASAEVVEDCRIIALDSRRVVSTVQDDPSIAMNMLASMSRHLHYLVHEVERLKTRTASQRLIEFILNRCRAESGPCQVQLPYDKTLIAARLGIQPESLSRLLNRFREFGVTTDQNTIHIADVARLRDFCPQEVELSGDRTVA